MLPGGRPLARRLLSRGGMSITSLALTTRISDLPDAERPRERLLDLGAECLASVELLAVLIGSGSRGRSALMVAHELLARAGTVASIAAMDPLELADLPGVGRTRACRIMAALETGKRAMLPAEPRRRIESPEDAAAYLMPLYRSHDREHFGILMLDARNGILARRTIAIGSLNQSIVHPREVFRPAVVARAARVVVFHNHPSGDPTPSPEDLALTRRLVEAGRTMGIDLIDHLVLGDARFQSVRSTGQVAFS